jgi:ribosomal protein L16 Arg81 hydroxylase
MLLLRDLVDDIDVIREHWPEEPKVYHHDPSLFRDLLTMGEVDALIDTDCIAARNIVLLRDGAVVEPHEYSDGDMPYEGAVRRHLAEGQSISLRLLHTLRPDLARFREHIRQETGCRTHVNAYLTPGHQQGLRYHYDPYITLIVQLHGRKVWHLHPPIVPRATEEYGNFLPRRWTDEERQFLHATQPNDIVLEPGDVFFLPRSWVHALETTSDEPSLHLTFALKQRTRAWYVEHLLDVLVRHVRADFDAREVVSAADLFDSTTSLEWARKYAIGALLAIDPEAAATSARVKARTT